MKKNKLLFLLSAILLLVSTSKSTLANEKKSKFDKIIITVEKEREIASPSAGYRGANRVHRTTEEFNKN